MKLNHTQIDSPTTRKHGPLRSNPSQYVPPGAANFPAQSVYSPTPRCGPDWFLSGPPDNLYSPSYAPQSGSLPPQYVSTAEMIPPSIMTMTQPEKPPSPEVSAPIGFVFGDAHTPPLSFVPDLPSSWKHGGLWGQQQSVGSRSYATGEDWTAHAEFKEGAISQQQQQQQQQGVIGNVPIGSPSFEYDNPYSQRGWDMSPASQEGQWAQY